MRFAGSRAGSVIASLAAAALLSLLGAAGAAAELRATITRTAQDIPTIVASDYQGAGYGIGFAMAQDNICEMAEIFATLDGRRSQFFEKEADGLWSISTPSNFDSDVYHAYLNKTAGIEKMLDRPPPDGPEPQMLQLIDGFVSGYNIYLARTRISRIPDKRCRGKQWVRPISRLDVARRIYNLANRAGRALGATGIATAGPPSVGDFQFGSQPEIDRGLVGELTSKFAHAPESEGSNAVGLGSDATTTGRGVLIHNPHWAWDGLDRFWQFHVKIPGELHSSGAGFLGLPMVLMGHNDRVAFTSTVSAARRAALVRTPLVEGDPMKYVVDGKVNTIRATPVTVMVRRKDGSLAKAERRVYSTIYGPITTSVLGLPLFPWWFGEVHSIRDAGQDNARIVNQFWAFNRARNVREFKAASDRYSANPWATETAVDADGEVYFGDGGAVPNVSDAHAGRCNTEIGRLLWSLLGLAVLDGARSDCDVPTSPGSVAPHLMPAADQPWLIRRDYATNSNEGSWLTNPEQPLEGYSRIFGAARTPRYARTRLGLRLVAERLAGGGWISRQDAQDLLFSDRNLFADMWRDELVAFCRRSPLLIDLTFTIADVREACGVLARWDGTMSLDSPGAVFFHRFLDHLLVNLEVVLSTTGQPGAGPFWRRGFDPADPVATPSGLNLDWFGVPTSLARAVNEFRWVGLPLASTLRETSYSVYGGKRTPIHGGAAGNGMFNAIDMVWRNTGYEMGSNTESSDGGSGGASFVMVTSFTDGCVDDRSLLLGSERSGQGGWPLATGQLELYAKKEWVDPPFCDEEIAQAGVRSITPLGPRGPGG